MRRDQTHVKVWHASITKDLQFEKMHRKLSRFLSSGEIFPKNEKLSTKEPLGLLLILFWEPFRYFPPLNINRLSFYNENTPFERLSLLSLFIFSARVVFLFWRGGKENNSLCLLKVRLWGFSIFFQIGTTATIALIPIHVRSHSRSLDPMILLSFCCVAWLYIYSIPYKLSLTF